MNWSFFWINLNYIKSSWIGKSRKKSFAFGVCVITAFVICKSMILKKYYKRPPVYFYNMPIIGALFMAIKYPKQFRLDILPSYGDIVGYNIGTTKYYKLHNVELINKLFQVAINRSELASKMYEFAEMENTIASLNDSEWEYRRKFFIKSLSMVLNKSRLEYNICKILQSITYEYLDSKLSDTSNDIDININNDCNKHCVWYPRECLRNISFNVIYLALFNKYYKLNNSKFKDMNQCSKTIIDNIIPVLLSLALPKIIGNLLFGEKLRQFKTAYKKITKLITEDHTNDNSEDNTDDTLTISKYYQKQFRIVGCDGNSKKKDWNESNSNSRLREMVADFGALIRAGLESTAHAMEVGLLLLAKYKKIQESLYSELNTIYNNKITSNVEFNLSNVNQCHKFRAFIHETLRIATPGPDGGPRTFNKDIRCVKYLYNNDDNSKDYFICDYIDSKIWETALSDMHKDENIQIIYDYIIEKGSMVEPNIAYLHLNKKVFDKGMDLNLNYWLNNNGLFYYNKNVIPFGVGKRDCPGQALAVKELYAFFGNLLLKYKILPQNNIDPKDIVWDYTYGKLSFTLKQEIPVFIKYRS